MVLRQDTKEALKALFALMAMAMVVIMFLVVVIGIIGAGAFWASSKSCHETADKAGLESEYTFWTECMVKVDSEWIPIDKWRVIKE